MGLDFNPPQTVPGGFLCPYSHDCDVQPSLNIDVGIDVVHPLYPLPLPSTGACFSPFTRASLEEALQAACDF